jgi:hypothetical protein
MSDKEKLLKLVSDALNANINKESAAIVKAIESELEKAGIKGRPLETWTEERYDSTCASGVASRTCHRVNHGDGTYSETWCSGWACI